MFITMLTSLTPMAALPACPPDEAKNAEAIVAVVGDDGQEQLRRYAVRLADAVDATDDRVIEIGDGKRVRLRSMGDGDGGAKRRVRIARPGGGDGQVIDRRVRIMRDGGEGEAGVIVLGGDEMPEGVIHGIEMHVDAFADGDGAPRVIRKMKVNDGEWKTIGGGDDPFGAIAVEIGGDDCPFGKLEGMNIDIDGDELKAKIHDALGKAMGGKWNHGPKFDSFEFDMSDLDGAIGEWVEAVDGEARHWIMKKGGGGGGGAFFHSPHEGHSYGDVCDQCGQPIKGDAPNVSFGWEQAPGGHFELHDLSEHIKDFTDAHGGMVFHAPHGAFEVEDLREHLEHLTDGHGHFVFAPHGEFAIEGLPEGAMHGFTFEAPEGEYEFHVGDGWHGNFAQGAEHFEFDAGEWHGLSDEIREKIQDAMQGHFDGTEVKWDVKVDDAFDAVEWDVHDHDHGSDSNLEDRLDRLEKMLDELMDLVEELGG